VPSPLPESTRVTKTWMPGKPGHDGT
jgi:hypothetical protein